MFAKFPTYFMNENTDMYRELGIDVGDNDFDKMDVFVNTQTIPIIIPSRDGGIWLCSLNGTMMASTMGFDEAEALVHKEYFKAKSFIKKHMIRSTIIDKDETPEFQKSAMKEIDSVLEESELDFDKIMGGEGAEEMRKQMADHVVTTFKFNEIDDWSKIHDLDEIEIDVLYNRSKVESLCPTKDSKVYVRMVVPYMSHPTTIDFNEESINKLLSIS